MTKGRSSVSPVSTLREQSSGYGVTYPDRLPRTDAQFEEYIHSNYFPKVGNDEFQNVIAGYPSGKFLGHFCRL